MPAIISLLRGVNVGGNNKIKMDELRALYESLGLRDPQTYVQSGNVVCESKEKNLAALAGKIETAIEKKFGFRPDVVLRTASEMGEVVAKNPFAQRRGLEPAKLAVTFLAEEPGAAVREAVLSLRADPEEVHMHRRELYIYFPDGMGRSKLVPVLSRALKNTGTARNWNTVTKLLAMAEALEAAE